MQKICKIFNIFKEYVLCTKNAEYAKKYAEYAQKYAKYDNSS